MNQLVNDIQESRNELKGLKEAWRRCTKKLADCELALAQQMDRYTLKSLQSFEHKITLNHNANKIRVYFWTQEYDEPTDRDVCHKKDLAPQVRAFLSLRNDRFDIKSQIELCKDQIKRRTDRLKKATTSNPNVQSSRNEKKVKSKSYHTATQ
jgi:hypothetical protein